MYRKALARVSPASILAGFRVGSKKITHNAPVIDAKMVEVAGHASPGFHRGMDYLLSPEATLAFIEDLNLTTIE